MAAQQRAARPRAGRWRRCRPSQPALTRARPRPPPPPRGARSYAEKNEFTHLYTLHLFPNDTYAVYFDMEPKANGSLLEQWPYPQPTMEDPEDTKPEDWVDERKIDDPDDKKPDGYDDIPKEIADPEATKPDDWDDEDDGEWEAPRMPNPEYKGAWSPKRIDNPAYKVRARARARRGGVRARAARSRARRSRASGRAAPRREGERTRARACSCARRVRASVARGERARPARAWTRCPRAARRATPAHPRPAPSRPPPPPQGEWKPREIPNPKYEAGVQLGAFDDIGAVGFELWIVNNGTVFDNVVVTDSLAEAFKLAEETWKPFVEKEKEAKEAWDKEHPSTDEYAGGEEDEDYEGEEEEDAFGGMEEGEGEGDGKDEL